MSSSLIFDSGFLLPHLFTPICLSTLISFPPLIFRFYLFIICLSACSLSHFLAVLVLCVISGSDSLSGISLIVLVRLQA